MSLNRELIAATAEPLVLSVLSRKENYGYALIKEIHALSRGHINWTEGTLYPVLHRLERERYIESSWKISETGRKRKYYSISVKGRNYLKQQLAAWEIANATIHTCSGDFNAA